MQPISRTAAIIERSGRRKKVEISVKRRFIRDWNTLEWTEIQRTPEDAEVYYGYRFEIINHDLHLAFAPSDKRLPFLRITDPVSGGVWVLWFVGWDDFTPTNPIMPKLVDRGEGYVEWRLDETTRFRVEILGHLIRKLIIVERRPVWNRLRFRLGRANALLVDGAGVGVPQKRLLAFRKSASWQDNPIFWFTEPRAWDSRADMPATVEPDYILTPITDALWDMEIALDPDWLDNAQYPVYIDPTIVLQPDAAEGYDTFINAASPDSNYGLEVHLFTRSPNLRHTLIKFTGLNSIPAGSTINSSQLSLYREYNQFGRDATFRFNRIVPNWVEMEATWNNYNSGNSWTTPGSNSVGNDILPPDDPDIFIAGSLGTNVWIDFDLTASTQAIINGDNNNGWKISIIDDNTIRQYFDSSDYSLYHPKLTVDYTEGGGIFIPAKIGAIAGKGTLAPLASA